METRALTSKAPERRCSLSTAYQTKQRKIVATAETLQWLLEGLFASIDLLEDIIFFKPITAQSSGKTVNSTTYFREIWVHNHLYQRSRSLIRKTLAWTGRKDFLYVIAIQHIYR
jgi:hypothetical protein